MVVITSSDEKTSGSGCDPEGWGTFLRCQKNVTGLIVLRGRSSWCYCLEVLVMERVQQLVPSGGDVSSRPLEVKRRWQQPLLNQAMICFHWDFLIHFTSEDPNIKKFHSFKHFFFWRFISMNCFLYWVQLVTASNTKAAVRFPANTLSDRMPQTCLTIALVSCIVLKTSLKVNF